jgi:hypothetical protein
MNYSLILALGLIVPLPSMATKAASTSCDAVSTPIQKVDEDTVRRIASPRPIMQVPLDKTAPDRTTTQNRGLSIPV